MLGLDNPVHIAFVLVLLLLVFGAKRLPEMGKSMGAGLRGFKESISGEESTAHLTAAHATAGVDDIAAMHGATAEPAAEAVNEPTPLAPVA
jgi:sec-independent protein translocase protein TatA